MIIFHEHSSIYRWILEKEFWAWMATYLKSSLYQKSLYRQFSSMTQHLAGKINFHHLIHVPNKENKWRDQRILVTTCMSITLWNTSPEDSGNSTNTTCAHELRQYNSENGTHCYSATPHCVTPRCDIHICPAAHEHFLLQDEIRDGFSSSAAKSSLRDRSKVGD